MFIKSNPAAFPHVLHFLLFNLEPAEFTSRFMWPLHSDKAVEKEFRKSCVKYINDLNRKYKMDMEEVGNYIVVVPGGMKFMKVLLCLIKLLQLETLKAHEKSDWMEQATDQIFDSTFRSRIQTELSALRRVNEEFQQTTQRELHKYQKKNEMIRYYVKTLEAYISESTREPLTLVSEQVNEICTKMQDVMSIVSELEKTCGTGPDHTNNPFERIHLSNAITRIVEHHRWIMTSEEYTHKIGSSSILDVASRILKELEQSPIPVASVQPLEVVTQNHDMALFLRNLCTTEGDLNLIKCQLKMDQEKHTEHSLLHPKLPVVFPERDYPQIASVESDLGSFYSALQRQPDSMFQNTRLALQDMIAEQVVASPPVIKSLNMTNDRSSSNLWCTTGRKAMPTARKKTKAMSVLKTISRSTKRPKINMDALKGLARTGFNESLLSESTTVTWKNKKSTNASSKTETSASEYRRPTATRLSGIFSESILPKFALNSTSIFNSTTNEQAQLQTTVFSDITNKDPVPMPPPVLSEDVQQTATMVKQVRGSWIYYCGL